MNFWSRGLYTQTAILFCSFASILAQNLYVAPLLVIPEAREHRLVLVSPTSKSVVGAITVEGWPHEIDFSNDGRTAYVPSYSDGIVGNPGQDGRTIDVVNMESRSLVKSWDLGRPLRPHKPMLLDSGTLLVSTELANSLSIVDTKTGKIRGQIPTGAAESHVFVKTSDGEKIYTANLHAGSVSVIDLPSRKLLKVIPVSNLIQRIALSKDERRLFVTDGRLPSIAVIDTAADTITETIAMGGTPFSDRVSPDGRWLLVGEDSDSKGKLEAIDLRDLKVRHSFDVDRLPFGIEIYGNEAFVACYMSGNLDVLNMATWTLEAPITGVAHGDGIRLWTGRK